MTSFLSLLTAGLVMNMDGKIISKTELNFIDQIDFFFFNLMDQNENNP